MKVLNSTIDANKLNDMGLWGYLYYYIGTDSSRTMNRLSAEEYSVNEDVETMYNALSEKLKIFDSFWMETMESVDKTLDTLRVTSYYDWDSAYTIAYVVQRLLDSNISLEDANGKYPVNR